MRSLLLCLLCAPVIATATPRAKSAEECVAYADLALVASAMARNGIAADLAGKMLPDVYHLTTADARAIANEILSAAYRKPEQVPREFAMAIGQGCLSNGGDIGALLGSPA